MFEWECPEGSYSGGSDALWLADFALSVACGKKNLQIADLGTGCGMVALSFLLSEKAQSDWRAYGLDIDPHLIASARNNAHHCHLEDRFHAEVLDVCDLEKLRLWRKQCTGCGAQSGFDFVLCNPPWRLEGQGRLPASAERRRALFGTAKTLSDFIHAAAVLLKTGGHFCAVVGSSRLADFCFCLRNEHFTPRRMRCIHANLQANAMLTLIDATRQENQEGLLVIEPPLIIMREDSSKKF